MPFCRTTPSVAQWDSGTQWESSGQRGSGAAGGSGAGRPARRFALLKCRGDAQQGAAVQLQATKLGEGVYASCLPADLGCKLYRVLQHTRTCRCVLPTCYVPWCEQGDVRPIYIRDMLHFDASYLLKNCVTQSHVRLLLGSCQTPSLGSCAFYSGRPNACDVQAAVLLLAKLLPYCDTLPELSL